VPAVSSDAIVGGNSNNGFPDGAFALNVNNALSNSNWNIGAAYISYIMEH
jgi:hypothetical protein